MPPDADDDEHVSVALVWSATNGASDDDDLDAGGIIADGPLRSPRLHTSPSREDSDALWHAFVRLWRRIPASWSVERDPHIALRQLLTLVGFISLCVFVFSVPSLLYVVSPRAPTPPGTAPDLDEAASMITGKNGAVAADHALCSELGVKVLRDLDGNAVDAMVSTVLCQGVLSPFASGLGGGAFILVHSTRSGMSKFYDARETAPAAANMSLFKRNATTAKFGGLAVAVPGELRGLYKAHMEWGRLPWKTVVQQAIEIAENAKVGQYLAIKLRQMNETIFSSPSLRKIFTKKVLTKKAQSEQAAAASVELPGMRREGLLGGELVQSESALMRGVAETLSGDSVVADANDKDKHGVSTSKGAGDDKNGTYTFELLEEGDRIENKALVETLKKISEKGPNALYGEMSGKLAKEVQAAGGVMTKDDIKRYKAVVRLPVTCAYNGFEVIGAPLPSAGGVSIAMALQTIQGLQFRRKGRNSVSYKMLVETLKWAFGARMGLGDPSFVGNANKQVWKMLSRREALKHVYRIEVDRDRTFGPRHYSSRISTSRLEDGTSHVSILDKNGTAVSVTSTINLPFGAGLVSNSTGILFNDQMDAFTTSVTRTNAFGLYPSHENRVEGGKRAISSMSPTILLRNGQVYMVVGGSGGPKAVSGVLQTILNVVDFGDSIADAISAPRLHHQLVPNKVSLEGANGTTCEQTHTLQRPSGGNGASGKLAWAYWGSVCKALKAAGHRTTGPAVHGAVQAVVAPDALLSPRRRRSEEAEGHLYAASDPRRIGKAAAY